MKRLGGVHTPHHKNTADIEAVQMPAPPEVRIPMLMHIGAPANPVVKAGDEVKVGQLIGEAAGFVSAPIHASVSGKVKAVEDFTASSGQIVKAVVITSDGQQTIDESVCPQNVTNLDEFLAAVRESGIVGLGGAGFPTAVKLTVKDLSQVEYVLINGAECEPYITSDTRVMLDEAEFIVDGVKMLQEFLKVKNVIFGIENNKPQCIKKLQQMTSNMSGVKVQPLPAQYPQGGEKVLIYSLTGRAVPEGKLPLDVGVIVINCTTLAAISKYIKTGMPLVSKCVTVDGSAIKEPRNIIAPIGSPVSALFEFCGGYKEDPKKILYGGPMMGIAVPDDSAPVIKNTNAVLAFNAKDAQPPKETACIRCGRCVGHCPMHLMPLEIETAFKLKNPERLEKLKVNVCMECGCCAFSCPAKRPLVQTMKLSKAMLRDYQVSKKEAKS